MNIDPIPSQIEMGLFIFVPYGMKHLLLSWILWWYTGYDYVLYVISKCFMLISYMTIVNMGFSVVGFWVLIK